MVPEMQKPRVTEINVRMDCNGCVQKIKNALNGITGKQLLQVNCNIIRFTGDFKIVRKISGIHDIYMDFSQQKITIIGWAHSETIVKAIKKTRKSAVICLHTEPQPPEPTTPDGGAPPPEELTSPTLKPTQTETSPPPPPQPPKEQPQPENPPPPKQNPSPEIANATPSQSGQQPSKPNDHEEIHVIHHHPPNYGYQYAYGPNFQQGYNGQWNSYNGGPLFRDGLPQPIYATHSYNTYKPSPYVTEYAYPRYSAPDDHSRDYYSGNNSNNGNITSMFSEENPNACRIM